MTTYAYVEGSVTPRTHPGLWLESMDHAHAKKRVQLLRRRGDLGELVREGRSEAHDRYRQGRDYGELPDDIAQTHWKEALDRLDTVASRCVRNAKAGKAATSLTEVMDVQSSFHSFAQRIENLRGQS